MSGPVAIGVGCRRGCPAAAIVALVETARGAVGGDRPAHLFSVADKRDEAGLHEAAARLRLPITFLPREALRSEAAAVLTPSAASEARFGVPSVSEAAALAGAGAGARLLLARIVAGGATCAVAAAREEPR